MVVAGENKETNIIRRYKLIQRGNSQWVHL